jgi:prephenate dehydratase
MRRVPIAVFGERGSFTEEAALVWALRAGLEPALAHHATMDDVLRAVEEGRAELGCVPVRNTLGGDVRPALEAWERHPIERADELELVVRYALGVARPGISLADVSSVASHPQALAQCAAWLDDHLPRAARRPWSDTAGAARDLAAGLLGPQAAVLASPRALDTWGLYALARDILGDGSSRTTFRIARRRS